MKVENRGYKHGPRTIHAMRTLRVPFGAKLAIAALLIACVSIVNTALATGLALAVGFGLTIEDQAEIEKIFEKAGEKHKSVIKTEIETAIAGLNKDDSVLASKLESLGLKDGVIKAITDAVAKQGEELRTFFEKQAEGKHKTIDEQLFEQKDVLKEIARSGKSAPAFKLNLAPAKTLVQRSAVSGSTMAMRLEDIGQLPYLGAVISGLFRHVQITPDSNGVIRYMDQESITRNAASRGEAGTAPESVISWIERFINVYKIMDSIPVTKEAFRDVGFIRGEIDRLLNVNLSLKEDDLMYDGDGIAPNIKGVYTSAGVYDGTTTGAGIVENANLYDLVACARVEISNNKQSKYNANLLVLNPADILRYKLAKATDGHYILPPFISADGKMIDGCTVVESSQVTANSLVIGDFRYGTIYDMEGIEIESGYINDQFVKDSMTLKASKSAALLIRTIDETAFKKVTDITAAIANINKA